MPKPSPTQPDYWIWLTRAALLLVLALVLARATITESVRDPFEAKPGALPAPRSLGASGAVVLDLLACLPALLVLLRASLDKRFTVLFSWSHGLLFAMVLWVTASTFWSADRFVAAVQATHWCSAAVLLWSATQLIRSWRRVRLVGAACFALLLVTTAHGLVYRFVDVPDDQRQFQQNREKIFEQRGWTADSFFARQFERKVMSGEIIGFVGGANTYAMMLVLTAVITLGFCVQRAIDKDEVALPAIMAVSIFPALLMLWLTKCRAAIGTAFMGAVLFAVCNTKVPLRGDGSTSLTAGRNAMHRKLFWIVVGLIVLGTFALIGHGLYHGNLVHDSLTFRWRYWIGSMRVFVKHPLLGVGFGNFGNYYLAVRLPIASEEIKDPHNFFVRMLIETGVLGGILILAWLGRLWWEMTYPREEPHEFESSPKLLPALFGIAALAIGINIFASIDLSQEAGYVLYELLKRILWFGLFFGGLLVGAMRSMKQQDLDNRPAPWLLLAMLASAAMFLLHNTIEFGMFEAGPLFAIMLVFATALGIRGGTPRRAGWVTLGGACLLWLIVAGAWCVPLLVAESHAETGEDMLMTNRPAESADEYASAFASLPFANADYAMKVANAKVYLREHRANILEWLNKAIAADPTFIRAYLLRAHVSTDAGSISADYESALALNPNDVDVRLEYAAALELMGQQHRAAEQYQLAIDKNEGLSPDEPKRLSPDKVKEIQGKVATLEH